MEPINFKLIAEKCTKVLKDTVQNKNIYDIEIEEFSSNDFEIYITIGFSYDKFTAANFNLGMSLNDPDAHEEVRKYRVFTIDRQTLEIISMGIREVNPRQNKYARVATATR